MLSAIDSNIWDIIAMPVGLFLCFSPALIAWIMMPSGEPEAVPETKRETPFLRH
jgi:hypothetical protein